MSVDSICKSCNICEAQGLKVGTMCAGLAKEMSVKYEYPDEFPKSYGGVRFTADAMDCALPISLDSHSGCAFNCIYCFANNLQRAPDRNTATLQRIIKDGSFYSEWDIKKLEKFLARDMKDHQSQAMYGLMDQGSPVQLGALGDPFDDLEAHSGWAKKAIPLFIKYKQPVRVGTKGGKLLQSPEYLDLLAQSPEQFWFAFSMITNSDKLISKIDINAPNTTERLKAMKALTDIGCSASIRFRPFIPGVSDAYKGEPEAWKTLITRSKDAGARAISFEYIFLDAVPTPRQIEMNKLLYKTIGNPKFGEMWNAMSNQSETCRRANRHFKYEQTKAIRDYVHELDMVFGISDPHFKEWNDTGCCCGMPDSGDKWFSKWSRRQMTEVIVQARKSHDRGEDRLFSYDDWAPAWAHQVPVSAMIAMGNWHNSRKKKDVTFGDHMRLKWNNPKHPRGPYKYFQTVLFPVGTDERTGDLVFKYREWTPDQNKMNLWEYND